jgi:hypothetical protein
MQKGSVLILTIVTVMIMSIMIAGLLTVGTTELRTSQNYQLKQKSFYHAVQGLETVIEMTRHTDDPTTIQVARLSSPPLDADGTRKNYYTGSMATGAASVTHFDEIQAPQLVGISLGTETGIIPIMYKVPIVSEVSIGSRAPACTEIEAGIYALLKNN